MYCFVRLIESGAILGKLADKMGAYLRGVLRVLRPPPTEGPQRTRRVFDIIYNLSGSHHLLHGKTGVRRSELLKDLDFLTAMDNGGLTDRGELLHFCSGLDGRPCCESDEDCRNKVEAAYMNLFMCHSCPSGSLSRWTHVGTMCSLLCSGFACRDAFLRAVLESLDEDPLAEA